MYTPDITLEEKQFALETLEEIIDIAKVREEIQVWDFGIWREPNYKNSDGQLVSHMSIDWYVNQWLGQEEQEGVGDARDCRGLTFLSHFEGESFYSWKSYIPQA